MFADTMQLTEPRTLRISTIHGVRESIVTPETRFRSPKVRALHDWWTAESAHGLPLRSAFDVVRHKAIVPNLFLVEVLPDGSFLLKLHGQTVIEMFGVNNTGRVVTDHVGVGEYGHALHEYYTEIVRTRLCRQCDGSLDHIDRGFVRFEAIDCPLSRDGGRVDYILGAIDRVAEDRFPLGAADAGLGAGAFF